MEQRFGVDGFPGCILVAAALAGFEPDRCSSPGPPRRNAPRREASVSRRDFRLEDCTFVTNDDDSPGQPVLPAGAGQPDRARERGGRRAHRDHHLPRRRIELLDPRRHAGSRSLHRRARRHRDPGGRGARVRRTASWSRSPTTSSRAASRTARCSTSARTSRTSRTARWSAAAAPGRRGSATPCRASSCRASTCSARATSRR